MTVSRLLYLAFLHPLSKYPGPKLWAITRVPWTYHVLNGDLWHSLDKFHDQYGPVVRIAPDELTYIVPEAWKDIYTAKPLLSKDPHSILPPPNGADSLFTAHGDNHKRTRGVLVNAFSARALAEQSTIIEDYARQFVRRLKDELNCSPSNIVDIHHILGLATFDVISDLTWGESPKALQRVDNHDWIHKFFLQAQFSTLRNCLSRFSPLDNILSYYFLRTNSKQRIANTNLTYERIHRRLAMGHARSDFMTPILGKISKDGPRDITEREVLTNGLSFIIANSQLGTAAITTAIYLLLQNPYHLQRLAEEIRNAGFEREIDITVTSTQTLTYLNSVINETLRLHHPSPVSLPRVTPKEGMIVAGGFVTGGSVVGVSLHNMHTRPENFSRPLEFHPERFFEKEDPKYDQSFSHDRLEAFQPFSTGPRNCIGQK
ncbi:cytochrome P450 [Biscogniauxia marginata]|nr:cytochrome P450 [Biscogniauxia marginata]